MKFIIYKFIIYWVLKLSWYLDLDSYRLVLILNAMLYFFQISHNYKSFSFFYKSYKRFLIVTYLFNDANI